MGEWGVDDLLSVYGGYDGGRCHLVDTREVATRRVGATGRAEDEGMGVGGGVEECGQEAVSLGVVGPRRLESPLYWYLGTMSNWARP